jgi:hypothetical protein
MAADPRDDFSGFAGSEHMFFGLTDPYRLIRDDVERALRKQVADTVVDAITMIGEPKFRTIGRKTDVPNRVIVAHFGFCLRATLVVRSESSGRRDTMPATLTLLFGHVDVRGRETSEFHIDLHGDAPAAFEDATFERRFLKFRAALG